MLPVYLATEGKIFSTLLIGLITYLSPLFLYYVRRFGTIEIVKKYYTKTIRKRPKKIK